MVKNLPSNEGDAASVLRLTRSTGEGNGNPIQHSCLGNPMDIEAWWVTVHRVKESNMTKETENPTACFKPTFSLFNFFFFFLILIFLGCLQRKQQKLLREEMSQSIIVYCRSYQIMNYVNKHPDYPRGCYG